MAPSIGDVLRITAKLANGTDTIQNVYHAKLTGDTPPTNEDMLDDVADWMDQAYSAIDQAMSTGITFDEIEVYNLSADEYVGAIGWPVLTAGTAASGQESPPQCAPLVLFRTNVLKSLGKKFLPQFYTGYYEGDGTLAVNALNAMAAYAAEILAGKVAATYELIPGNYRPLVDMFIPYVSAVVRDFFATQRRRYVGRGS
jgi:hypothetical protein